VLGALAQDGYCTVPEPVEAWEPLLHDMYRDADRWSMTFNVKVLADSAAAWAAHQEEPLVLFERSPLACRHVFAELQRDLNQMTDREMQIVDDVYKRLAWMPDVLIYIRTTPDIARARLASRGRRSEASVPWMYLQRVADRYEQLVNEMQCRQGVQVHIIDGNQDKDHVLQDVRECLKRMGCEPGR
jgi:deoxyadenosine/deoxycytidine kinase